MKAEICMIGTELLLGQIVDTNAAFMGQTLAQHGIHLYQKTTVGDNLERIMAALDGALQRSDVVLCSGGLGPTEDDITREAIAALLNRPLEYREALYEALRTRFSHLRITENNRRQAMLPQGAEPIENPNGTAPGLIVADERGTIICMPGVPSELKPMLTERVIPYLKQRFGVNGHLRYHVLKVCGLGESRIDSMIGDIIMRHSNPTVGLLASPDAVRIRIAAYAGSGDEAEALIAPVEEELRTRLPGLVMGRDDDTLEGVVDALLQARGWRLQVIEQSTGGMISQRLTAAGAASFAGGRVIADTEAGFGLDTVTESLVESGVQCTLVLAGSVHDTATVCQFTSPEHREEWRLPHLGNAARRQLRLSVAALEQVRRVLTGVDYAD